MHIITCTNSDSISMVLVHVILIILILLPPCIHMCMGVNILTLSSSGLPCRHPGQWLLTGQLMLMIKS